MAAFRYKLLLYFRNVYGIPANYQDCEMDLYFELFRSIMIVPIVSWAVHCLLAETMETAISYSRSAVKITVQRFRNGGYKNIGMLPNISSKQDQRK